MKFDIKAKMENAQNGQNGHNANIEAKKEEPRESKIQNQSTGTGTAAAHYLHLSFLFSCTCTDIHFLNLEFEILQDPAREAGSTVYQSRGPSPWSLGGRISCSAKFHSAPNSSLSFPFHVWTVGFCRCTAMTTPFACRMAHGKSTTLKFGEKYRWLCHSMWPRGPWCELR